MGILNLSKVEIKKPTKRHRSLGKGRTSRTNQNKLRELTKFYEGLFKRSQENKKKNPNKTKYFCDRFLTLDSFLKYQPLKKLSEKR